MDALAKELASVSSEYESFWEELDEDIQSSLKKEDSKGEDQSEAKIDAKRLKEKYQEVLNALSNEATRKYAEYLALKPKQKLVFQAEHTELTWPEETEKIANGTYKVPAIKAIVEKIKNEIEIPEDEDDYKVRHLYLLSQRISVLKKEIKEIKTNLDNQARTAITSLSDDQVKSLLREKWLAPAMQSIFGIPAAVEGELRRKIQEIIKKYQNPISELNSEIEKSESQLEALMKQLVGNSFDMAAIAEMRKVLGGDKDE